ncbi:unnamed protein product [Nippostrongylus brasiliensis]|uniref:Uncharacterized protein n=1 Tax=Nippostrongylus brasiliensis TaxID=27835 RepID=A0A0N4XVB4_NIPBR|nr:unnamed protein product [Nippostrongylus brasiliensis]
MTQSQLWLGDYLLARSALGRGMRAIRDAWGLLISSKAMLAALSFFIQWSISRSRSSPPDESHFPPP